MPLGPLPKQPFYWTFFRTEDGEDAPLFAGRTLLIGGELWIMLREEDARYFPSNIHYQTRLDENALQQFEVPALGTCFFHRGALRHKTV